MENPLTQNSQRGEEPNPFMKSDTGDNPFKVAPKEDTPFKGYERAPEKHPEPKVEKPGEKPSIFKGEYGVVRSKYLSFVLGKKDGYKDFKSLYVTPTVRHKMVELRDRLVPKNQEYVKKYNMQMEVNKIKRELGYKTGDDHVAAVNILKEIKDKTGIK
jgi:hypothetical protein